MPRKISAWILIACAAAGHGGTGRALAQCADPQAVELGTTTCGALVPGAADCYAFDALAGDVVWIRAVELASPQLELRMRLYAPDGGLLATSSDNNFLSDILDQALPASGTYTIEVLDAGMDDAGDFCLHLQRINGPANALPAVFGPVQCGSITSIAEVEAYTFDGTSGDVIWIRLVEMASPQLELRVRLYGPDATLISAQSGNNALVDVLDLQLSATGTYTLLVYDDASDDTGDYRIEVEVCEEDPCPPFCPADSNGDGRVDVDDLLAVILHWGLCECCDEDTVGFGAVTLDDLIDVIVSWGPCF